MKHLWMLALVFVLLSRQSQAQGGQSYTDYNLRIQDSTNKEILLRNLGNGYFPTKYFNFDLRYLSKYNQYEGFRTGLGGLTTNALSEIFRIQTYLVYGFRDDAFKYSIGGGLRLFPETNTWIHFAYTEDLEETGSSAFLTDKRFFQLIEPRRFNISLFHHYISQEINIEHRLSPHILTETELAHTNISPKYDYVFRPSPTESYTNFDLSYIKFSMQWSPFSKYDRINERLKEVHKGFPKFTLQYTHSFEDVFKGNFNFNKIDLRVLQVFDHKNESDTEIVLTTGYTSGEVPLTHAYHAFPNNVNKETILQRFSIAGTNSFETMYFNEFFSDKVLTFRVKHKLKPFNISPWFKPQLAFLTKFAIGDMDNPEQHEMMDFSTLEKGYLESGIEINRLIFGFGLSFAYRYGAYHLPKIDDNIAFKFTFYLNLEK